MSVDLTSFSFASYDCYLLLACSLEDNVTLRLARSRGMSLTTATGRALFSFIFIASAVNKYVDVVVADVVCPVVSVVVVVVLKLLENG